MQAELFQCHVVISISSGHIKDKLVWRTSSSNFLFIKTLYMVWKSQNKRIHKYITDVLLI